MKTFTPETPDQALGVARLAAIKRAPYFRAGLNGIIYRESEEIPTLAVSENLVMLYNRKFVMDTSTQTLAAGLVHELLHVLHTYWKRAKNVGLNLTAGADPATINPEHLKDWMISHDCEINDDLKLGGWSVGEDWMFPSTFGLPDNQLAEVYFDAFRKGAAKKPQPGGVGGKGPAGAVGHGGCIGPPSDRPGSKPGRSKGEVERVCRQVASDVQTQANSGRGNVPAGWVRWANALLTPPKVRWQDRLGRLCRAACDFRPGQTVSTYSRPSRRQQGVGMGPGRPILSSTYTPTPRILVAVDTSGSMGDREGQECIAEAAAILRTTGGQVTIVACDAEVHACKPVRHWKDILPLMKGGGGTSFLPIFETAARMRARPQVIVVLTDGEGPAPATPPKGIHTIWCLVGKRKNSPASWGSVVTTD